MKYITYKADIMGMLASTLCIIHCLITPLLFISHICSDSGCANTPIWWKNLDFLFLTISFFAIYSATQKTSKKLIKHTLWLNWNFLFILILNERIQWILLPNIITHSVAFTLAVLHLYNLKYCQCKVATYQTGN